MPRFLHMLQCPQCGTYYAPKDVCCQGGRFCGDDGCEGPHQQECPCRQAAHTGKLPERGHLVDMEV